MTSNKVNWDSNFQGQSVASCSFGGKVHHAISLIAHLVT